MITYIKGKVIKVVSEDKTYYVDILLQNGLAYRVFLLSTGFDYLVGDQVEFYTSFQVREESQTLYGFKSEELRDFFEKLIGVSGVGPKTGISVLSTFSLKEIREMVSEGDFKALSKAPGLGAKGAQKIIVEMKGRFKIEEAEEVETDSKIKELRALLKSLGFKSDELNEMVKLGQGVLDLNKESSIEQLLQSVLRNSK